MRADYCCMFETIDNDNVNVDVNVQGGRPNESNHNSQRPIVL